ncbi:hypothetical protein [Oligoflexus tunisiensis]|uniref:hypothetical protein n=1 Tax=Oligoflexus tunisiensis TaxID=708132 RepID=UPI00114CC3BB|nr:hypothetical protein [Oligoflexus tunisiensis]
MVLSVATSRRFLLSVLLVAAPLSGCNFKEEKDQDDDADQVTVDPSAPVTFAEIYSKILQPSCHGCHSVGGGNEGGVNLESYSAVKEQLVAIRLSTVDSTRMPKGDILSANLRALLGAWIEQGAPE